jgi:ketosteroid isomerase-like protein
METQRSQNTELIQGFFKCLETMDTTDLMEYWAEGSLLQTPLAPGDFPRVWKGKPAIEQCYRAAFNQFASMKVLYLVIYPSTDCNLFIVEYQCRTECKLTGGFTNRACCGILRLESGKIARFTKYFEPSAVSDAANVATNEMANN